MGASRARPGAAARVVVMVGDRGDMIDDPCREREQSARLEQLARDFAAARWERLDGEA